MKGRQLKKIIHGQKPKAKPKAAKPGMEKVLSGGRVKHKPKPIKTPIQAFMESIDPSEFAPDNWTPKNRIFVQHYLRHKNGSRAIKEAGYRCKPENRAEAAYQILKRPDVRKFVDDQIREQQSKLILTSERVLDELACIAFTRIQDLFEIEAREEDDDGKMGTGFIKPALDQADAGALAAISEVVIEDMMAGDMKIGQRIKVKMHNKQGALEALGKHFKLFGPDLDVNVTFDLGQRLNEAKARLRDARKADIPGEDNGST